MSATVAIATVVFSTKLGVKDPEWPATFLLSILVILLEIPGQSRFVVRTVLLIRSLVLKQTTVAIDWHQQSFITFFSIFLV